MRVPLATALVIALAGTPTIAHDIPDERVDRSIQATLSPGKLRVDYEVSLTELTLVQDLRRLAGESPKGDREVWFDAYGREIGPLIAKGLLVLVDGGEVALEAVGFDLAIEGHPRYLFHFVAAIPGRGRLTLNDTNYAASEGTSRLALRPAGAAEVRGDSMPTDVSEIPIRPTWQLSNRDEERTRRLTVNYASSATAPAVMPPSKPTIAPRASGGLSKLLDQEAGRAWPGLLAVAFLLGMAHAIQPGHGKTLVAAASIGPRGGPYRGALLGLVTAMAHLSSVALIALAVWMARPFRLGELHLTLARLAGFAIAAVGLWRVGRHLGGHGEHEPAEPANASGFGSLLALGLAGGVVPCWDAVALVVLSQAIGRLPLGLTLLAAFSLGMAGVLVAVGSAANRFRNWFDRSRGPTAWERRFGIVGGLILTGVGLSLLR